MSDDEEDVLDGKDNPLNAEGSAVKVCVRVRPFIKEEIEGSRNDGKPPVLCMQMKTKTSTTITKFKDERDDQFSIENKDTTFEYDRCYWSHNKEHPLYADQKMIYREVGRLQLSNAIQGYNNCLFAYGQTGSGKSFSVLGASQGEHQGLLPRIVRGLFDHFDRQQDVIFKCVVSFIEIYQENIADLLIDGDTLKKKAQTMMDPTKLKVREHAVHGVYIPGLTEVAVASRADVMKLIDYGMSVRHTAETAMNATSSRSHCIFTFKTSVTDAGSNVSRMSQTHLVDLAGSERARRTQATGDRLKEGASINQSLSTLAHVISELAKASKKSNPPFRNSKLTLILKESLSGNSKTVMMAAIAPSSADYSETFSTLKFAQSVKLIQTKAKINQVSEGGMEEQLRLEVQALQERLNKFEADKQSDSKIIADLNTQLEDRKQLQTQVAAIGSKFEETLKIERERPRQGAVTAARLPTQDFSNLNELNKQLQQLRKEKEQVKENKKRAKRHSSLSIVWSGGETSEESEEDGEMIKIRLNDLTLSDLRSKMSKLKKETSEVEKTVNLLRDPHNPELRLTPTLCLTLDGNTSRFVVRSQRIQDKSNDAGKTKPSDAEEWLSEAEFKMRSSNVRAFFPQLSGILKDDDEEGEEEEEDTDDVFDAESLQRKKEEKEKVKLERQQTKHEEMAAAAKEVAAPVMGNLSAAGVDIWAVTGFAQELPTLKRSSTFTTNSGGESSVTMSQMPSLSQMPDLQLIAEVKQAKSMVKLLRGQLMHAHKIITNLTSTHSNIDWPPGNWNASGVETGTTRYGKKIPNLRRVKIVRKRAAFRFGDDTRLGLVGKFPFDENSRRCSEPALKVNDLIQFSGDSFSPGSRARCVMIVNKNADNPTKLKRAMTAPSISVNFQMKYEDAPSDSDQDSNASHDRKVHGKNAKKKKGALKQSKFDETEELQKTIKFVPEKMVVQKEVKDKVVDNIRKKFGSQHHLFGIPGKARMSAAGREAFERAVKETPTRRTPGGRWVGSLSLHDSSNVSFAQAMNEKDPAVTLLEAMRNRRAAETVREVLYPNPSITGNGGDESVESTLEVLWKSGLVQPTKPGGKKALKPSLSASSISTASSTFRSTRQTPTSSPASSRSGSAPARNRGTARNR